MSTIDRSGWIRAWVCAVALAAALAACGSDGDAAGGIAGGAPAPKAGSGDAAGDAEADADGSEDLGDLDLPRTLTYGGVEWTVDAVSYAPATTDGEDEVAATVRLDFTAVNTLEGTRVRYPAGLLALAESSDILTRAVHVEGLDSELRVEIRPEERVAATAVFEVDGPPAGTELRFVIDEGDKVPGTLALSGADPEIDERGPVEFVDPQPSGSLRFFQPPFETFGTMQPLGARWALDWGAERAELGTHFLVIDLRANAAEGNEVPLRLSRDSHRLVVDGTPREPHALGGDTKDPDPGTSADRQLVFVVPDDARTVALSVGADGADEASWDLDF